MHSFLELNSKSTVKGSGVSEVFGNVVSLAGFKNPSLKAAGSFQDLDKV